MVKICGAVARGVVGTGVTGAKDMRDNETVVESALKDIKVEEPSVRASHVGLVCRAT